ncbi:hypothetical protein PVAG01_02854 [Phlyctema vagabunda]|uniref:2EXR domain-containing protein n=1 Tax=Phlyctema vagabunda TaxID=108571 RepID=A0ABR4PRQ4_9HELO
MSSSNDTVLTAPTASQAKLANDGAATEFTLFPELAVEIRDLIWKHSLPGPQTIKLIMHDPSGAGGVKFTSPEPVPAIFNVCKESRAVALKAMPNQIPCDSTNKKIFYDAKIDTICFIPAFYGVAYHMNSGKDAIRGAFIDRIYEVRNLVIPLRGCGFFQLKGAKNLRNITFTIYTDCPRNRGPFINLGFQFSDNGEIECPVEATSDAVEHGSMEHIISDWKCLIGNHGIFGRRPGIAWVTGPISSRSDTWVTLTRRIEEFPKEVGEGVGEEEFICPRT